MNDDLLFSLVEEEILRQSNEFIKAQLLANKLDLPELIMLRDLLKKKNMEDECKQPQVEAYKRIVKPILTAEEAIKEKRRAYARTYYQRKKKLQETLKEKTEQVYKTTKKQREYQKAYYLRKKSERPELSDKPTSHEIRPIDVQVKTKLRKSKAIS